MISGCSPPRALACRYRTHRESLGIRTEMKVQGKRCGYFYYRPRDFYGHGLARQGKGKQTAGHQDCEKARISHGFLLNSVCFLPTRRAVAPWDSDSRPAEGPGAAAQHLEPSIRAKDRSALPAQGAIAAAGEHPKLPREPGAAVRGG